MKFGGAQFTFRLFLKGQQGSPLPFFCFSINEIMYVQVYRKEQGGRRKTTNTKTGTRHPGPK
jgi:hypothetical protein